MEYSQMSLDTNWKPNRWVALLLSILLAPFSMLYLSRPRLALFYFLAAIFISYAQYWLTTTGNTPWLKYVPTMWLLGIFCAVHSYRLSKSGAFPLPRNWYSRWYGMLAIMASFLIVVIGGRSFLYEPFRIPANSMSPTLPVGANIIVKKLGFGNYGTFGVSIARMPLSEKIERGDIMVFQFPRNPAVSYVKRIIGLPGDVVSYKSKALYINDVKVKSTLEKDNGLEQVIEERYGNKSWQTLINPARAPQDFAGKVPEHEYFVLGDNRDNSADSRYWGFVPEENLIGKMVYVIK